MFAIGQGGSDPQIESPCEQCWSDAGSRSSRLGERLPVEGLVYLGSAGPVDWSVVEVVGHVLLCWHLIPVLAVALLVVVLQQVQECRCLPAIVVGGCPGVGLAILVLQTNGSSERTVGPPGTTNVPVIGFKLYRDAT